MKNVYIITPGGRRARGGIGRMVDYIVRSWENPAWTLHVVDTYGPGPKWLMPFYGIAAFARVVAAMAIGRVDLLHIHMSERLSVWRKGLFVAASRVFLVPVVLHLHGADFRDWWLALHPILRLMVGRILNMSSRIVCLGEYWNRFLIDEVGVDKNKISILHNAAPVPMDQLPGPFIDVNKKYVKIIFLGAVCERKGVSVLIEALASPTLADLEWRCVFAGDGEIEVASAQAAALGIGDRVEFKGWIDEDAARAELSQADVMTLPSRNEGLPMAILEAMSFGCAIVTTAVGSIPDAVIDGETGLLVPVGDSQALALALARLIVDVNFRADLGERARKRFAENHTISIYNEKLSSIFSTSMTSGKKQ